MYSCRGHAGKCDQKTTVFHGTANDFGVCVTPLLYWPDVLEEIESARLRLKLPRFACVKPRYSRTVRRPYVSQGCLHCDAIVGEHYMWEDFIEVFSEVDMASYPNRYRIGWPPRASAPGTRPACVDERPRQERPAPHTFG